MKGTLPKPTILQLDEFDINQRIVEALTNVCSKAVLFSTIDEPKDAPTIAQELQLSLSAVYKTLSNLEKLTLVQFERFEFVGGKKIKQYRSQIKKADITIDNDNVKVKLYKI